MNNSKSSPLVSVVIPFYNTEKYIAQAIQSILRQTYTHFELIIINDASTDHSKNILQNFHDERIIYIENEKRKGVAACMNIGMDLAKGKYIARMDSDDIAYPQRFEKQVEFLERENIIDILGTFHKIVGEKNIIKPAVTSEELNIIFMSYQYVLNPSLMMRAGSILKNNLRCNETFTYASDYDFLISALIAGLKLYNLPVCLMEYRRHATQISTANFDEQSTFSNTSRKKYLEYVWKDDLSELEIEQFSKLKNYSSLSMNEFTQILEKIISTNEHKKLFNQQLLIKHFADRAIDYCEHQTYKSTFEKIKACTQNSFIKEHASHEQIFNFRKKVLKKSGKNKIKKILGMPLEP